MKIHFGLVLLAFGGVCIIYGVLGIILKKSLAQLFFGLRLFLGVMLLSSGMGKFAYMVGHFDFLTVIGPADVEEKLAPHGLALYGRFIAYSQVLAGALLLSGRFATLGAIVAFPILLSITIVTVSQKWGIAPINKIFVLMNALVLLGDWHRLKFLLFENTDEIRTIPFKIQSWKKDGLIVLGLILIILGVFFAEYGVIVFSTFICTGVFLFIATPLLSKK